MQTNSHIEHGGKPLDAELILSLPFLLALVLYLAAVIISWRRQKAWPLYRTVCWVTGAACSIAAVAGPISARAHADFSMHMVSHLLLGMLAPLLMVMAAPMTLIFRTINVNTSRKLTRMLKSGVFQFISHPLIASLLNVGGLWILYTTNLFSEMHQNIHLYVLVHLHVFLAGYLFTASFIATEPIPHRTSFVYRANVLISALAGHGILSKYLYAHPPAGIPMEQAEKAGILMYYGGDAIDFVLIFIFCYHWYNAARQGKKTFTSPC